MKFNIKFIKQNIFKICFYESHITFYAETTENFEKIISKSLINFWPYLLKIDFNRKKITFYTTILIDDIEIIENMNPCNFILYLHHKKLSIRKLAEIFLLVYSYK